MEHDGCKGCLYETELETSEHCMGCIQNAVDKYTPMTNADRIRAMTDEELAIFMEAIECNGHGWCEDCQTLKGNPCNGLQNVDNPLVKERLDWLKEKVE